MSLPADEIRYEVRRFLASRPTAAVTAESVVHGLKRLGHEITPEEALTALTYLEGLGTPQVKKNRSSLNTHTWQITSAGVVAYENNE